MNIIIALLIFSVIVTIHEFGHFIFAKMYGIEVLEFSVGMGPRILKYKGKETLYSIKLLPFGGSCRMLGEDDFEDDEDIDPEKMKKSFHAKSVWERFMVVFAGPLFNFILAFIVSIFVVAVGGVTKPVVGEVMSDFPAQEAGIKTGDIITKVNGHKLVILEDYRLYTLTNNLTEYNIELKRKENGVVKNYSYSLKPKFSEEAGKELLGFVWNVKPVKPASLFSLLSYSAYEVYFNVRSALAGLRAMVTGLIEPEQISGPVGIVNFVSDTIDESGKYGLKVVFLSVASLIVLLSANLGVMNLLPIPALDGGRIVFYIFEMLTRKKPNKKLETFVHVTGFAFLMAFMCFVIYSDIMKLIYKQ